MENKPSIVIIGAGLTGLTAAYVLRKNGIAATILEARERLGGRIHTHYKEGEAAVELGATWLGKKHQHLINLLSELGLEIHEQVLGDAAIYEYLSTSPHQLVQLPPNTDPSFRIKGGSSKLIEQLAAALLPQQVHLGQVVKAIQVVDKQVLIQTNTAVFEADYVISTLPPNLLVNSIDCTPNLPKDFLQLANQTHTWMGESIKVGLTFKEPIWKELKLSATIMSNVGPIGEMYDHSNPMAPQYALKGFLNGAFHVVSREERQAAVLKQLTKYYGVAIHTFSSYVECVWRAEPFTFMDYKAAIMPHQNNGHALYQQTYLEDRLLIAGSETATSYPGYMDGAVASGYQCVERVLGALS